MQYFQNISRLIIGSFFIFLALPLGQAYAHEDDDQFFTIYAEPENINAYSGFIALDDADGKVLTLDDFEGKLILLNFWATWCPPCVREMPNIDALQEELGGDNFEVIAVSLDYNPLEAIPRFLSRNELPNLNIYYESATGFYDSFEPTSLPQTYLISPEGKIIGEMAGPAIWDSPEAIALIERFLPNDE